MEKGRTVEEIGAKMVALDLWDAVLPFNWAVKPHGLVIPYFCLVTKDPGPQVRVRLLMLEGWQTLHDFLRSRLDHDYGFFSAPIEFPHLELIVLADGSTRLFRHDAGYMPVEANERQRELAARILWEAYGVMLRLESDPQLPMKFAEEKAIFARVETQPGVWEDAPLAVPDPRPHVESVSLPKAAIKQAQDLPFAKDFALELDFRLQPQKMTREPRPRCVYELVGADAASGERLIDCHTSIVPEEGLRGVWQSMPPQVLAEIVRLGRVPGEVKTMSGRVFRLLRPLCMELPFKLSLHDSLPHLTKAT